jgi:chemotaxis protein MotD
MTVSIGHILPSPTAAQPTGQAATDSGDITFQDVLGDGTKHSNSRQAAPHIHRLGENGPHRAARNNETDLDPLGGSDEADETNAPKARRFPSTSASAIGAADDDAGDATKEKPGETSSGNAAHERLPLLMSLQEINRASANAEVPDLRNTGGEGGGPTGRRGSIGRVAADVDSEPTPARFATARGTETQQTASKTILATAPVEPAGEPDASAAVDAGKPKHIGTATEAARTSTIGTHNDRTARAPMPERVTVVSAQSFPAPAMPGLGVTTSGLVTAIASDSGLHHASSSAVFAPGTAHSAAVVAHTLKIELHPAELGVVNAHLRLTGEQLSVELLPDTQEAYHRLSSDGDAIARALRDLGFDVGKVTVLQPSIAASPTPRLDTASSTMAAPGRDSSSFQPGQSGGNGNAPGHHQSEKGRDNDVHNSGHSAPTVRDRAGNGLVI